jgi:hypothetical protein
MSAVLDSPALINRIKIPYRPRNWAIPFHRSFKRFSVKIIHRRGGKTTCDINKHQRAATDDAWEMARLRYLAPNISDNDIKALLKRRTYWHVMPTYHQAKITGAWDLLQEIARPIPGVKPNQAEMSMLYPNGNRVQLVGGDNPDALRGGPLSGCSLDEYSQIHPAAFGEVLSKSLADHLGYADFSGTIKGMDQLFKLHEMAKNNPEWFTLWQDIDKSLATEEGATIIMLRRALEDDRKLVLQGVMSQAEFDQEWYLSPEAAIKGAFYGTQMKAAREQGRICRVPHDPMLPVDTDWDLGVNATAIWFSQSTRSGEIRCIDYYEDIGGGMEAAIKAVKGQMPELINPEASRKANARRQSYTYGEHWGPHDTTTTEIFSGKTRQKMAFDLGVSFKITPKLSVSQGITAAQFIIGKTVFDEQFCAVGIENLRHYHSKQQQNGMMSETPVKDGHDHGADAFRGLAVRHKTPVEKKPANTMPVPRVSAWS